jgi:F0F1-type ATP synthase membrane subunit a
MKYEDTIQYIFSIKFICKKIEFLYTLARNMNETTTSTHPQEAIHTVGLISHETASTETTHATTEHVGPHIPSSKGEIIPGFTVAGFPITNTILSTWIFMAVFFVLIAVFYTAITTKALPRIKALGLDVVNRIFSYATSLLGSAQMARRYMWLLGGIIVIVFVGNIFGLILDWLVLISEKEWLAAYLRPMYSDLSTTLVFSLTVIIVAQITAIAMK